MRLTGDRLRSEAERYIPDYLRDLERFVNMDSGTTDRDRVQRAGEFAAEIFRRERGEVEWVPSGEPVIADTYIARRRGNARRKVVLLGHHDTVYPSGTAAERPFQIRDGRAYGPGVMDMKGGVILGAYALRLLIDLGIDELADMVFVGNPDEEIGSPTSRRIIEREALGAELVLVLEPGREPGSIQTTRKGVGMYELSIAGRAAHAGARPEDGRSALLELAHKIISLQSLTDFRTGTTINVGVAQAGTRRNVVPDHAEAQVDLRVATAQAAVEADRAIRRMASRAVIEGTTATITGGMNRPPMEKTEGTERVLDVGRRIVSEMGLTFLEVSSGGGSDGNFTAALGIPTLDGLGPVGRNAHSPDEWLDTSSLPDRLALVAGLIAQAADSRE